MLNVGSLGDFGESFDFNFDFGFFAFFFLFNLFIFWELVFDYLDSGKIGNYKKMSAVMEYMQKYHFSWTLVTYNIVINAFGRAGDLNQMEFLFRLMQSESIKPNCHLLLTLDAYGMMGCLAEMKAVLPMMESKGCQPDKITFTYRTMIKAYNMNGMSNHVKELRLALSSVGKPEFRR